jgi:uncharacterized protein YcfL
MKKYLVILVIFIFIGCANVGKALENMERENIFYKTVILKNIKKGEKTILVQGKNMFLLKASLQREINRQVGLICNDENENGSGLHNKINSKWSVDKDGLHSVKYTFKCNAKLF